MSCLFNSFSALVGERPQTIRAKICDWLATDPALMEDLSASLVIQIESGQPLDRYVANMRSVNTWGGAIEIRAFVQLWKRPVRVFVLRARPRRWIEFPYSVTDASGKLVETLENDCKISWTGGHYEPIRS
jgi:hypothetical protein